jgi:hypothetical protein
MMSASVRCPASAFCIIEGVVAGKTRLVMSIR